LPKIRTHNSKSVEKKWKLKHSANGFCPSL
jgi:hypothetical protein